MTLSTGLVSTILPVFNRPAQLREAVASVLAQDWRPIEIIVVDDGSTDGDTPRVADELAAAHPGVVRVVHQANAGPGAAREAGRRLASGEFIQYLDSDDLLLPGKFSAQVAGLRGDAAASISYGVAMARDARTGSDAVTHRTGEIHRTLFPAILQARIWPTLAPLYRRSICDAIGPWTSARILEDWDYDLRAGMLDVQLHYCAQPLAVVRHHGGDHAGMAWQQDADAMRDRVAAYIRAAGYASQKRLDSTAPEMRRFARTLFWMAREAAAYGLEGDARTLYVLARERSGGAGLDYSCFRAAAGVLGWKRAGRLAHALEGWR